MNFKKCMDSEKFSLKGWEIKVKKFWRLLRMAIFELHMDAICEEYLFEKKNRGKKSSKLQKDDY